MTVSEPPQTTSPSTERAPLLPALQVDFEEPSGFPPEPKIEVEDVHFWYGKHQALKGITLTIYANRVTAFIGPSGCGKSTLLRTFNRMYQLYPKQRAEGKQEDGESHGGEPSNRDAPGRVGQPGRAVSVRVTAKRQRE